MGVLVALRPCIRCGSPGRRQDVYFREKLVFSYSACAACLAAIARRKAGMKQR